MSGSRVLLFNTVVETCLILQPYRTFTKTVSYEYHKFRVFHHSNDRPPSRWREGNVPTFACGLLTGFGRGKTRVRKMHPARYTRTTTCRIEHLMRTTTRASVQKLSLGTEEEKGQTAAEGFCSVWSTALLVHLPCVSVPWSHVGPFLCSSTVAPQWCCCTSAGHSVPEPL